MANSPYFFNYVGLIYLAIQPPTIIKALDQPPSTLAVELYFTAKLGPAHTDPYPGLQFTSLHVSR